MRTFYRVLSAVFVLWSLSTGQSVINLCGIVTNAGGSPISGVAIKLRQKNLTAISASDGSYCIQWNAGVLVTPGSAAPRRNCEITGKRISVTVAGGERCRVRLFDIRGRLLWQDIEAALGAGRRDIFLPIDRISAQTGILLVNVGDAPYSFRFAGLGGESLVFSKVNAPSIARTLGKTAAPAAAMPVLDTLVASGSGFTANNTIRSFVYLFADTIDFTMGEADTFSEARQQIVHRVNDFRATLGLKRLKHNRAADACVDTQAQMDFTSNTAHSAFQHCGELAQNECTGWTGANMLLVANNIIVSCMQQMWDEGPGTPYSAHGHYINMTDTSYSKISCGFYYSATAHTTWATQDFF